MGQHLDVVRIVPVHGIIPRTVFAVESQNGISRHGDEQMPRHYMKQRAYGWGEAINKQVSDF